MFQELNLTCTKKGTGRMIIWKWCGKINGNVSEVKVNMNDFSINNYYSASWLCSYLSSVSCQMECQLNIKDRGFVKNSFALEIEMTL